MAAQLHRMYNVATSGARRFAVPRYSSIRTTRARPRSMATKVPSSTGRRPETEAACDSTVSYAGLPRAAFRRKPVDDVPHLLRRARDKSSPQPVGSPHPQTGRGRRAGGERSRKDRDARGTRPSSRPSRDGRCRHERDAPDARSTRIPADSALSALSALSNTRFCLESDFGRLIEIH